MPIISTDINSAPSFKNDHVYLAKEGSDYSIDLTAEDSDGDQITFRTAV